MNLAGDVQAREWERVIARSAHRVRPSFVAVDGEGIEGRYVLLAASGNHVPPLVGLEGLATRDMLAWLLRLRRQIPDGTRLISYRFNYDVQKVMADLTADHWTHLAAEGECETTWEGFTVRLIPRKYLEVVQGHHAAIIDDIAGFFGVSFIKALEEMRLPVPAIVREGKAARGEFIRADLPRVVVYNNAELACMVQLADAIATFCERLQVTPHR